MTCDTCGGALATSAGVTGPRRAVHPGKERDAMLTPRGNVHRHTLPPPGAIVTVRGLECTGIDPRRKAIVESYPLTDSADYHFSRGIHTVTLRFLDNNTRRKVAGHYCWEVTAGSPVRYPAQSRQGGLAR